MPPKFDFSKVIAALDKSLLVSVVDVLLADEIEKRSFHKIRCTLIPSRYKLDIKYIRTEKEFFYSYQVYTDKAIARWDNEPHYPGKENFPHHFQKQSAPFGSLRQRRMGHQTGAGQAH